MLLRWKPCSLILAAQLAKRPSSDGLLSLIVHFLGLFDSCLSSLSPSHLPSSPRDSLDSQAKATGFHLQSLPLMQEEVIILSQKEGLSSSSSATAAGFVDHEKTSGLRLTSSGGGGAAPEDGLVLPTHVFSSHTLNGHHHHNHPDLHSSHCPSSAAMTLVPTSTVAAGSATHHHVHFLHPHLSQVQILDTSDGLLDPQIVTSSCNDSSSMSRASYMRS